MYQKDFILFVIEQFARVLKKILAQILGGEHDDAEFQIEQIYRQYLGLNSDLIDAFAFSYLMHLQSADPEQYPDRCIVLAEILNLDSVLLEKRELWKQAFARRLKALNVYLKLQSEHPERLQERTADIRALHASLQELQHKIPIELAGTSEIPAATAAGVASLPG